MNDVIPEEKQPQNAVPSMNSIGSAGSKEVGPVGQENTLDISEKKPEVSQDLSEIGVEVPQDPHDQITIKEDLQKPQAPVSSTPALTAPMSYEKALYGEKNPDKTRSETWLSSIVVRAYKKLFNKQKAPLPSAA